MRKAGDIYIDNEPFRITSYQRGTTDDMVARFGSAEKGQTNLDLFKAATQKSWRGGMFQKKWADEEMAGYISGFHHNPLDEKLYLTPEMDTNTNGSGMDPAGVTAWCHFNGNLYIAYRTADPSAANAVRKINLSTGTVTSVTLPAAISGAICYITSMIVHGTHIFLAGKDINGTFTVHRYDGNTTFTSLVNTNVNCVYLVSFNDKLYGMGLVGFFLITSEFSGTAGTTSIKVVGASETGLVNVHGLIEYNGAVYIAKTDGLFRYNGVEVQTVINRRNNVSTNNFKNMTVFNGRLYWSERGIIYEFDGVNIVQVVDMSDAYTIINMAGGDDRLWISVRYNATSASIYESDNFTDPIVTETYTYGLFTYNGIGFYQYKSVTHSNDNGHGDYAYAINFTAIPTDGYISWFHANVYLNASLETRSSGFKWYQQSLASEFNLDQIGTSRESVIIGSVFDAGYPSVTKTLNAVMAEYENFGSNILMVVEIRKVYEGTQSAWIEVFRSDNVSATGADNDYFLHDQVYDEAATDLATEPHLFHHIEYKITVTVSGALTEIPKWQTLTMRYTLQPRMRRQWVIGIALFGDDESDIDIQELADGTRETRKAMELRRIIYDAYENKLPILFYDIDFTQANYNSGTSKWELSGVHMIKTNDFIAIKQDDDTWYNSRVTATPDIGTDKTALDFHNIGQRLGIGGAAIDTWTNGTEVRKSYAAYVRRIQQERVIPDDITVNTEAGYSDYSSELVIEIIEA